MEATGTQASKDESKPIPYMKHAVNYLVTWSIVLAMVVSGIILYSGNWPVFVIVESSSMQHSNEEAFLGVMDTGDMVISRAIDSEVDVVSYMKGKRIDHQTYGEFGDVIIFKKNGYSNVTPVIHRALIWIEFNTTTGNSWDVPELRYHDDGWHIEDGPQRWYNITGTLVLENIGWDKRNVNIHLGRLLNENYLDHNIEPHSGFITMGDNNRGWIDQHALRVGHSPVEGLPLRPVVEDWIVGVARGELPGLGIMTLRSRDPDIMERAPSNSWSMFFLTVFLIILLLFLLPLGLFTTEIIIRKRRVRAQESSQVNQQAVQIIEISHDLEKPPTNNQSGKNEPSS